MTWQEIKEHLDAGRFARRTSWLTNNCVLIDEDGRLVWRDSTPVSERSRRWFEAAKDWEVC